MIDKEQTSQLLSIFFAQDDKIQVAQVEDSVRASSLAKSQCEETAA